LPPNAPAANFWSVIVYDALTASGLDNGQPFPSLNSFDKPVANPDGSTDIFFAPGEPSEARRNCLRTLPGKGYFVILRRYNPTPPYFEKTWKPGDLERVA
jgi:hypothetical protein